MSEREVTLRANIAIDHDTMHRVIIGEAINRCSPDFARSHPEIPYK